MKVAIVGCINTKIVKGIVDLLRAQDKELIHIQHREDVPETDDLLVFGTLEGLEMLKGEVLLPINNVELVHLYNQGERLSDKGFKNNTVLHKLSPKKSIVRNYLKAKLTTYLELTINYPVSKNIPQDVVKSELGKALSKGVKITLAQNSFSWASETLPTSIKFLERVNSKSNSIIKPIYNIVGIHGAFINNFSVIVNAAIKDVTDLHNLESGIS